MLLESLGACIRRCERRLRLGELLHCVVEFTVCAGITARLVGAGGGELVAAETINISVYCLVVVVGVVMRD